MFFRNLTLFRFSPAVAADLERLDEALAEHRLRPCGPLEMFTKGFVPPVGRGEELPLTHSVKQCTLMTVGGEDKLLPAAVINDELQRKVQKIAEEEGRKVGGRERKRIKEDLLNELLPRAFVRNSRMSCYVDKQNGWLVLDTSSRKSAENALSRACGRPWAAAASPITISSGRGASGTRASTVWWCERIVASVTCLSGMSNTCPAGARFSMAGSSVVALAASRKKSPNRSVWISPEPCSMSPSRPTMAALP